MSKVALLICSGCEEVMNALDECHARGFLYKAVGGCNSQKTAVNKCLRAERLQAIAKNRQKAKEQREKREKLWKEVDENS
jgi:COX assembly protein 2